MLVGTGQEPESENSGFRESTRGAFEDGTAAIIQEAIGELFGCFVSEDGLGVDYDRLLTSDEHRRYEQAAQQLASFDPLTLELREERLAFWINLYNMSVLQEVGSFRGVSGWGGVNGLHERKACNIGGLDYSFDDIEYGILRGNARRPGRARRHWRNRERRLRTIVSPPEPRVCFALTRASRSGPALRFYDAARIEAQLYRAAFSFIGNGGVIIDRERDLLSISQIFREYSADFGGGQGVLRFIADHLAAEDAAWVRSQAGRMRIKYHHLDPELDLKA